MTTPQDAAFADTPRGVGTVLPVPPATRAEATLAQAPAKGDEAPAGQQRLRDRLKATWRDLPPGARAAMIVVAIIGAVLILGTQHDKNTLPKCFSTRAHPAPGQSYYVLPSHEACTP